ncbi:MAG TPA: polysaccharide deacetylase family protein [Pirellulaceae bacterium]|nr:polysaccharide deacetylase family protein [Pirellulaceae bacterium]HMP67787.1 polysaccharide deacetylase family protein [Pirellulaceae bacterium]
MPLRTAYSRKAAKDRLVPIGLLFYHRISNEWPNAWTMSELDFERQIDWLSANFELISLEETQKRITVTGNDTPAISITFDDGYADNCRRAIPMLLERSIPFTYFVTLDNLVKGTPFQHDVDLGRPLWPNSIETIKVMAQAGVEIGSHTRTHRDLGTIHDEEVLFDEVVVATRELEELIGKRIRYFAFPFGREINLNQRVFAMAQEHGFEGVCSTIHEWNSIGGDAFHLKRFHGDPNFARLRNWLTFDPRLRCSTGATELRSSDLANPASNSGS